MMDRKNIGNKKNEGYNDLNLLYHSFFIMYKILSFIVTFILFIGVVNAYTQSDLDIAASKGYILSDQFSSNGDCDTIRISNNADPAYAGWNRTQCFNVESSYYYLIGGEGFSTDLVVIFRNLNGYLNSGYQTYNELYIELTDSDRIDNMSLTDLINVRDTINNNPNLSGAEKALLLGLIDDEIFKKLKINLSNSDYISKISVDDLNNLKKWIEYNPNFSQDQKDELLGLIDSELSLRDGIGGILVKIGVDPGSEQLYIDLKTSFDNGELEKLNIDKLKELREWIKNNPDLTSEEKAILLGLIDSELSLRDGIGGILVKIGVDPGSEQLYIDLKTSFDNGELEKLNIDELKELREWIKNNPDLTNEEKAILLGLINDELNSRNGTIDDLFVKYNIDTNGDNLLSDLEKLIISGKLSANEEVLLKDFINKTKKLTSDNKNYLLGLFIKCTNNEKKALKFTGSIRDVICIDKTIRTCSVNKINYVPFSKEGGIIKFYDDRFFEKRTGMYYWKCLDDSRFQKIKPLVCLNGYKRVGDKCKLGSSIFYKVNRCKVQCSTFYLGKKIYYNKSDGKSCECVYFKDKKNEVPSFILSKYWDEENKSWIKSKDLSYSSNIDLYKVTNETKLKTNINIIDTSATDTNIDNTNNDNTNNDTDISNILNDLFD